MSTYQNSQPRNPYYEALRGLAILMVIAIHTFSIVEFDSFSNWLSITIRQILNCAVPIFLAISGFFIAKKGKVSFATHVSFLRKQIAKIYLPTIFWSLPLLVIYILNHDLSLLSVLKQLSMMLACGYSVYYFIILIIQFYILAPILLRAANSKIGICLSICSSIICVIFISYIFPLYDIQLSLVIYAGPFPLWIMFFMLGMYISSNKKDYPLLIFIIGAGICLILSILETYFLHQLHGGGYGIKISSFLFSACVIFVLLSSKTAKLKPSFIPKFMVKLGEYSFILYLIHCYIIMAILEIIKFDYWCIKFIIVTSLSVLFVLLLKLIIPTKWQGFIGVK